MASGRSFFSELKRRNVLRTGVLYIGVAWALSQGAAQLLPVFDVPTWAVRWLIIAAAVGFPFWLAFAWYYKLTPEGLKRESDVDPKQPVDVQHGKQLDRWIIATLAIAVVLLLTDRLLGWRRGAGETASAPVAERSIAVLPFVDLSQAKDQEYFSDGISEELLNLLARVTQLQVVARTSSFSFKGKEIGIPEIARTLHVAHVLEGSVRKSGNQVRVSAQLIRAADGFQLWSQSYDRRLDDIFAIQDDIAHDVVKELRVTLLGDAPKVRTTDPQAYALYLQAHQLSRELTAEAFAKSDELYRKALAIDPKYAPAWDGLARNFDNKPGLGLMSDDEGIARAREAAEKALEIDPDYAPAHEELGWLAMDQNDIPGAVRHYERALALDPGNLTVLFSSAVLLQALGRLDEAIAIKEGVIRHDPVHVGRLYSLGLGQRWAGRLDAAIATYRTVLSLSPNRGNAHAQLGLALLLKGEADAALAEVERESNEVQRLIGLPIAYYALGRKADSDAALETLVAKYGNDLPYNVAYVCAFRGEPDAVFEWLDKAAKASSSDLPEIVVETLFDHVRSDPRWLPFLRKVGKAPEQLAKIEFKVPMPVVDAPAH
jgi:TolB-like protein/Tfp pilus assembly protein PilF